MVSSEIHTHAYIYTFVVIHGRQILCILNLLFVTVSAFLPRGDIFTYALKLLQGHINANSMTLFQFI
jgi:hypothetical protein